MKQFRKIFILVLNMFLMLNSPFFMGNSCSLSAQEMDREQLQALFAQFSQQQSEQLHQKKQGRWEQIDQVLTSQKEAFLKNKQELLDQKTVLKKTPKSPEKSEIEKNLEQIEANNTKNIEDIDLLRVALSLEKQLCKQQENDPIEFLDEISMNEMSIYKNQDPENLSLFDQINRTTSILAKAYLMNQLSTKPENYNTLQNNGAKLKKLTEDSTLFQNINEALNRFLESENFYLKNLREKQLTYDFANISSSKNRYSLESANIAKRTMIQIIIAGLAIALKNNGVIVAAGQSKLSTILGLLKNTPIINKIPRLLSKIPGTRPITHIASFLTKNIKKLTGRFAVQGLMLLLVSVVSIPVTKFVGPQLAFLAPLLNSIPMMGHSIIPMIIQSISNYILAIGFGIGKNTAITQKMKDLATNPALLLGTYAISEGTNILKTNSQWTGLLNHTLTAGFIATSPLSLPLTLGTTSAIKTGSFFCKKFTNWWRRPAQIKPHIKNVQKLLNSLKEIDHIISIYPEFSDLSTEISMLINPIEPKLKNLIEMILKSEEKYAKNRKLMEQIFENINELFAKYERIIFDAVRAAAKVDYFVSLARLFNEYKNKENKFCLVDYINTENDQTFKPCTHFINLWNPTKEAPVKYHAKFNTGLQNESNPDKIQAIGITTLLTKLGLAPATTAILTPFSFIRTTIEEQEKIDLQEERELFTNIADTIDIGSKERKPGLVLLGNSKYQQDPINRSLFNTIKQLYRENSYSGMGIFA